MSFHIPEVQRGTTQGMNFLAPPKRAAKATAAFVVAACKNARFRRRLKQMDTLWVNFGCGPVDDDRFISVDARPMKHVDLVTSNPMLHLLRRESVDLLYASHVFEHISYHDQHAVLFRWHALLKPGGVLRVSVPDFDKLIALYAENGGSIRSIQAAAMGGQDYPGNCHYALFNREHLSAQLRHVGFGRIDDWDPQSEPGWPLDSSRDVISLNLQAEKI
jgi:predicted SAM-dependent methyltransferase